MLWQSKYTFQYQLIPLNLNGQRERESIYYAAFQTETERSHDHRELGSKFNIWALLNVGQLFD